MKYKKILVVAGLVLFFVIWAGAMTTMYQQTPWRLADVSGHLPDLKFSLIDDNGKPVTEQSYHGKVVLLYFGFTHCPDLCPVTVSRISGILQHMGKDADNVRFLFVTVDPARDSPKVLHAFLTSFDPQHMIGLTGGETALQTTAKRYRSVYQPASKNSAIMHGDAIYIFDVQGHARLIATGNDSDDAIAHDLRLLAHAGQ